MVVATADGGGSHVARDKQFYTVTILDLYEEMASVRAASPDWIDYLHLVRQNGEWLIVNVLYTANRTGN